MPDVYDESSNNDVSDAMDVAGGQATPAAGAAEQDSQKPPQTDADKALVTKIQNVIKADKKHFKKDFLRMRKDQFMAMWGRDPDWPEKNYKANIVGRHIGQKTATLYAKNPRVVANRKEMLDFAVWDETPQSLVTAMQVMQANAPAIQAHAAALAQYQAAMQAVQSMLPKPQVDPTTGQPVAPLGAGGALMAPGMPQPPPPLPPDVMNAQAIIADVQQGMQRRQLVKKFGKTLELVYAASMRQQTPLDFKSGLKGTVRRAATNSVGYVEMGFQREYGVPPGVENVLDDCRTRLDHLAKLQEEAAEGEIDANDAEMAELEHSIANLEAGPQACIRSGLTFKWVQATKVTPDKHCTWLGGFLGGKHITVEEIMSKKDASEQFKHDFGQEYTPYNMKGEREGELRGVDMGDQELEGVFAVDHAEHDMVCIFKHYDKRSGLVYWLCEGHSQFLTPPAAPDVTVPRFWPVYALTFNATDSETHLFGPSDVALLRDQQNELNRSRQGKREHRQAARPRFVASNGTFDPDKDLPALESAAPFEIILLTGDPNVEIAKRLQPFPMPGVDPNLYDTNEVMQDGVLTVGASASQLGGTSKSTATEAAIADGSVSTSDSSSIDDLDSFLTAMSRDGAIILTDNLTKEDVVKQVGVGAVWVEDLVEKLGVTPEDIHNEIFLEVEAGSSGKPNQPMEVRNFKELAPLLMQIPGISPDKLGREAIRRLDDKLDLNEWIIPGLPAMVAQNRAQPMQPGDNPGNQDPNQQGDKGGDKGPPPAGPAGTGPAMGDNHGP
jgi:hypothetical protein